MVVTEPMKMPRATEPALPHPEGAPPLPAEVELILSALETGQYTPRERRYCARARYRVKAILRLYSDQPDTPPWTLYTRDVNARGLGFATQHRLPLGHGGLLEITLPTGEQASIACTLLRCREAAPGWYEGSLYFNRQQIDFLV